MKSVTEKPTRNAPCFQNADGWLVLQSVAAKIVDEYVVEHELSRDSNHQGKRPNTDQGEPNPHAVRIASEHCYYSSSPLPVTYRKKRHLPEWLRSLEETPKVCRHTRQSAPDGVFDYSSAVLNDGLLLLELWDAIREGDGIRVLRCWKFMLLYWRYAGHTKYCLEALRLWGSVNATATPRIVHEIVWCH